jgi:hypothetical protein
LLKEFRTIILQDAAILCADNDYKNHNFFNNKMFKTEEFLAFQKAVLNAEFSAVTVENEKQLFRKELNEFQENLTTILSVDSKKREVSLLNLEKKLDNLNAKVEDVFAGLFFIEKFSTFCVPNLKI